jgi:hypothetical protein
MGYPYEQLSVMVSSVGMDRVSREQTPGLRGILRLNARPRAERFPVPESLASHHQSNALPL